MDKIIIIIIFVLIFLVGITFGLIGGYGKGYGDGSNEAFNQWCELYNEHADLTNDLIGYLQEENNIWDSMETLDYLDCNF